ncbi:MAG TPA: hypothetical protein VK837_00065 [Longimicrobiales bacterium]|nr:hypothetical protein [Longimicrobiales bacterium]
MAEVGQAEPVGADGTAPSIDWFWVGASVVSAALLLAIFLAIVDPGLARPRVSGALFVATLVFTGMLIGYRSPGATTWEPGVGGLALVAFALAAVTLYSRALPPAEALVLAPLTAPLFAIAGSWTGEMLQGTYRDDSPGLQWLWVLVAIVVGFSAGLYAVFLAEAIFGINYLAVLAAFAASFMLTGAIVGYFSPGKTILEPAVATGGLIAFDVVFTLLYFRAWFPIGAVLLALVAGIVLSVTGAWMGEAAQDIRVRTRSASGATPVAAGARKQL